MRIRLLFFSSCISLAATFACAEGAGAIRIDDFSTAQTAFVFGGPGFDSNQVSGAGILGGERDLAVVLNSGSVASIDVALGSLAYWQLFASLGTGVIVWDGPDGSPVVDYTGLGGVDFTDGGGENSVVIPLLSNNLSAPLVLTAYTDASNFSTATVNTPGGVPPLVDLTVLFTDFVDTGPLGGADFANIGAFSLFIDGNATPDLNLDVAAMTPEPSTATLLVFGILVLMTIRRRGWVA
jgi:hypothetical protein